MICFSYLSTGFDVWGPQRNQSNQKDLKSHCRPQGLPGRIRPTHVRPHGGHETHSARAASVAK